MATIGLRRISYNGMYVTFFAADPGMMALWWHRCCLLNLNKTTQHKERLIWLHI
jgi:hypothetical protein